MKLTTARLKKLIREELNKVLEEAISIPGYSDRSKIENAIKEAATELGHGDIAGELASKAAKAITGDAVSGFAINTKKMANPANSRQPGNPQEEAFMIITKIAMEMGVEETQASAIGNKASVMVARVQHQLSGSKDIKLDTPLY